MEQKKFIASCADTEGFFESLSFSIAFSSWSGHSIKVNNSESRSTVSLSMGVLPPVKSTICLPSKINGFEKFENEEY